MKSVVHARQSYQSTAIRGANPIELVILLYDAAIEDMRLAHAAMQAGEIEARGNLVGHALLVLQQLQGTLDFERGGKSAKQFEHFYNLVRAKLLEAQIRGSGDLMQQQIRHMSEVRDCWVQAKRMLPPGVAAGDVAAASSDGENKSEWSA